MNPILAGAAEMLGRLCIAAPVIFAGLLLVVDPLQFLKLVNTARIACSGFGIICNRPHGKIRFLARTQCLTLRVG